MPSACCWYEIKHKYTERVFHRVKLGFHENYATKFEIGMISILLKSNGNDAIRAYYKEVSIIKR